MCSVEGYVTAVKGERRAFDAGRIKLGEQYAAQAAHEWLGLSDEQRRLAAEQLWHTGRLPAEPFVNPPA